MLIRTAADNGYYNCSHTADPCKLEISVKFFQARVSAEKTTRLGHAAPRLFGCKHIFREREVQTRNSR